MRYNHEKQPLKYIKSEVVDLSQKNPVPIKKTIIPDLVKSIDVSKGSWKKQWILINIL